MTNAKLIERALRYKGLRAMADSAKKAATTEGEAIITELRRRNVAEVDHDGVHITKTARTITTYDADILKAQVKPSVFRRVVRMEIDREALALEVKAGNISSEERKACATSTTSAAYPVITRKPPT